MAPALDVGRRSNIRGRHEPPRGASSSPRRSREAGALAVLGHVANLFAAEAARRLGAAGGHMVRCQAVEAFPHQVGGDRPALAARKACIPPGTTLVDDRAESICIHQGIPAHLGWGSSDRSRPTRIRHKTARSTHRRGGSTASFRQLAFSFRRRARRNPVKLLIFVLRIRRQTEANPSGESASTCDGPAPEVGEKGGASGLRSRRGSAVDPSSERPEPEAGGGGERPIHC